MAFTRQVASEKLSSQLSGLLITFKLIKKNDLFGNVSDFLNLNPTIRIHAKIYFVPYIQRKVTFSNVFSHYISYQTVYILSGEYFL